MLKSLNIVLMLLCALLSQAQTNTADTTQVQSETVTTPNVEGANVQSLDGQGDEAYAAGDYLTAIELYKQAIATDGVSPTIYYNLGNAYFRADSIDQAIINYERALKLDPTFNDARTNLDFVNTKIIDTPSDALKSNVIMDNALSMMTANGWAITAIVIFFIVILLAAGYIFMTNIRIRKVCFFSAIVILLIDFLSVYMAITSANAVNSHTDAIVTEVSVQLSTSPSSPTDASQQAFLLHEGSKVRILQTLDTPHDPYVKQWYEVLVDEQHRAWIDASAVEII